jgi:hypothetical protein
MIDIAGLVDLLEDYTAPKWEEHPHIAGFRVEILVPDAVASLVAAARGSGSETERARQQAAVLLTQAVNNWEGLTVAGLRRLLPPRVLRYEGNEDIDVPFSPEMRDALIRLSEEFVIWVASVVARRRTMEDDAEKN